MQKLIFLADIDLGASPKVRSEVRGDVVTDYAESYKNKVKLPPPHVFELKDQKSVLLADGLHRVTGAKIAGLKVLACEVHKGTAEDCLEYALAANVTHGLRRSLEDKRRSAEAAIAQWPSLSDLELARRCHVSNHLIADTRKLLQELGVQEEPQEKVSAAGVARPARNSPRVDPKARLEFSRQLTNEKNEVDLLANKATRELKDTTGYLIPKGLHDYWDRIPEVKNLISNLRTIRDEIVSRQADKDLMYSEVNIDSVVAELNNAISQLKTAVPYAVCTNCQGKLADKCSLCKGRGLISKFRWDMVSDDIKQLRTKGQK